MRELDIKPNVFTYNAMIVVCCFCTYIRQHIYWNFNVIPSLQPITKLKYNHQALRDNGHTEAAIEKFNNLLSEKNLKPSERSFNTGLSIPLTDFANALQASELCMKVTRFSLYIY